MSLDLDQMTCDALEAQKYLEDTNYVVSFTSSTDILDEETLNILKKRRKCKQIIKDFKTVTANV